MVYTIIGIVVTLVIAFPLGSYIGIKRYKDNTEASIGDAKRRSEKIIDEAISAAESKKREIILKAEENAHNRKNEIDAEIKERRSEMALLEKRNISKEEALEKKSNQLEEKEAHLKTSQENVDKRLAELDEKHKEHVELLEKISGFTSEEAKKYLLQTLEQDIRHEKAVLLKELDAQMKADADKHAKEYIIAAIQRCASDHVSEATVSVVDLPNDDMKGRIIGREGRNIRTIENVTGVELIVDDTPEAIVLSSFDPVRREVARIAIEHLIVDGRIHPTRIEETVEKARKEMDYRLRDIGENVLLELGINSVHPEIVRLIGRLEFRTSYGQNALRHSMEVARLSGILAAELGEDVRLAKRAGLLHDIGKAIDYDVEGSHIKVGLDICRKYKEHKVVLNAIESHHGDVEPNSVISCIIQAADAISAARPGARRETLEAYTARLSQLEDIANAHDGVEKSFAIQAGREIRVIVTPEKVSEDDIIIMAREIAKQIEDEMSYPGQVKVNVIRESRASEYAK